MSPGSARPPAERLNRRRSDLHPTFAVSSRSSWTGLHAPCRCLNRADNVVVARATAKVSGEPLSDLLFSGIRVLGQQCPSGNQHARSAESALQGMVGSKLFLQRRKPLPRRDILDGSHVRSLRLNREHETTACRSAIDKDGAGATAPMSATNVRSGQVQAVANEVAQQHARLGFGGHRVAVHRQLDVERIGY